MQKLIYNKILRHSMNHVINTIFFSSLLAILYCSRMTAIYLGSIVKGCEEGAHPLSSVIYNAKYLL